MAFEAYQALGLGGEVHDVYELGCVALVPLFTMEPYILIDLFNGKASGTVTRLAVHKGKSGFGLDLLTMDAPLEIFGYLIVLVTLRDAIVGADILGIEAADYHPFVFTNRKKRLVVFQLFERHT